MKLRYGCVVRNTRSVLLSDEGVRVAVVLLVLSCVLIVTLVLLTSAAGEALVGWFYFTTVDFEDVWAFGPFASLLECDEHRVATVPREVETTSCVLMNVEE